jgi:hypothetical protein
MSESKKSFWSSIPGLVTGLAGLLTGIVGLVTVLIQLDVIGGDDAETPAPGVTTTVAGATTGSPVTPTTALGTFTLSPKPLTFGPNDKVKTVTVRNTSDVAAITLMAPKVIGDDAARFTPAFDTCSSAPLGPNLSCTIKVTFAPTGPLATYKATLQVVPATGAVRGDEVPITASTLLGG